MKQPILNTFISTVLLASASIVAQDAAATNELIQETGKAVKS